MDKEFLCYQPSLADLRRQLSSSELAALAISSYCSNDVNALVKLLWRSNYKSDDDPIRDWLRFSQESALLRSVTLRLFEFLKFLRANQNQNGDLGRIAREVAKEFYWVENSVGHEVAEHMRSKIIAHTSMADAKDAIKNADDDRLFLLAYAQERANDVYSMGEELLLFSRLKQLEDEQHSFQELYGFWQKWVDDAQNMLSVFHVRLCQALITEKLCDLPVERKIVSFDSNDVFDPFDGKALPTVGVGGAG